MGNKKLLEPPSSSWIKIIRNFLEFLITIEHPEIQKEIEEIHKKLETVITFIKSKKKCLKNFQNFYSLQNLRLEVGIFKTTRELKEMEEKEKQKIKKFYDEIEHNKKVGVYVPFPTKNIIYGFLNRVPENEEVYLKKNKKEFNHGNVGFDIFHEEYKLCIYDKSRQGKFKDENFIIDVIFTNSRSAIEKVAGVLENFVKRFPFLSCDIEGFGSVYEGCGTFLTIGSTELVLIIPLYVVNLWTKNFTKLNYVLSNAILIGSAIKSDLEHLVKYTKNSAKSTFPPFKYLDFGELCSKFYGLMENPSMKRMFFFFFSYFYVYQIPFYARMRPFLIEDHQKKIKNKKIENGDKLKELFFLRFSVDDLEKVCTKKFSDHRKRPKKRRKMEKDFIVDEKALLYASTDSWIQIISFIEFLRQQFVKNHVIFKFLMDYKYVTFSTKRKERKEQRKEQQIKGTSSPN